MADTSFNPDAYLAAKARGPSGVPADAVQVGQFDPDAYLTQKQSAQYQALQDKYGSAGQQAIAGVEGAARGVSLGASDLAETNLGLDTPENIKGRMAANPLTSFAGNALGSAALIAGTEGLGAGPSAAANAGARAATLGAGVAGPLTSAAATAAKIGGMTAEGALFGAGNAVSDYALGDPDLNAQKVLAHIGMGAALGAGLGVLSKGVEAVPAILRSSEPIGTADSAAEVGSAASPALGQQAKSLSDIDQQMIVAQKYGGQSELTALAQNDAAMGAAARLNSDLQFPITDMQLNSLKSPDARIDYKMDVELPGRTGTTLRNLENAQSKELDRVMNRAIDSVAPGYETTSDAAEAGERASRAFTEVIEPAQKEAGEAIKRLKGTAIDQIDHTPGLIEYLTNPEISKYADPKLASMFDTAGDAIEIKPFNKKMGMAEKTYSNLSKTLKDLESGPTSLEDLFNLRKGIDDGVNPLEQGGAGAELTRAKAAIMDYIQDLIQHYEPDAQVRSTMAKYAQIAESARFVEKKIGAEIGTDNWRSLARGKSDESILSKIFRDSETVAETKKILPSEKFNQILADHLAILKHGATTDGALSTAKFANKLKAGQYALGEAVRDNPAALQKIQDAITLRRMFPDSPSANPPHTARTLLGALAKGGLDPFAHVKELTEYGKERVDELRSARAVNLKLAGRADQAAKLKSIQGIAKQVGNKITSGAKAVFESPAARGGGISSATALSNDEFKKQTDRIKKLSSDPTALMEHLSGNTEALYSAAPAITQSLHHTMVAGLQFLNSKIPRPTDQMTLSQGWEPSRAQRYKFENYYRAVNDPLSVLSDVKNNSVTNESLEALTAVNPALLTEMRNEVMGHMKIEEAKNFPYAAKLSIAKFLGQPLDSNMTPMAIQTNQQVLSMPNLSKQDQVAGTGGRVTVGGMKELSKADRVSTGTQGSADA